MLARLLASRGTRFARAPSLRTYAQQQGGHGVKEEVQKQAEEVSEAAGNWFKEFITSKLGLVATGASALVLLNLAASTGFDLYYKRQVLQTLLEGVTPPIHHRAALPRQELRQQLHSLIMEPSPFFSVVAGLPGSGKSTMLKEVISDVKSGVGYIDVNPCFQVDFGKDLGLAFNFKFEEHVGLFNVLSLALLGSEVKKTSSEHPLSSLRRAAEALHSGAEEFRRRQGRPFVLVIDSADRLGRDDEGKAILHAMLEYARDWASEGVIRVVWVAHSWRTLEALEGAHPTRSRASPPVMIGDISTEESLQYLSLRGVEGKLAHECVRLAGGSLLLLERCASMIKGGLPFEAIKGRLLDVMELAYLQAGLLDGTPQQDAGLSVVEALMKSKQHAITAAEWRERVPRHDQQTTLLDSGVFDFDGRTVRFASRLAAVYAAERLKGVVSQSEQLKHRDLSSPRRRWW